MKNKLKAAGIFILFVFVIASIPLSFSAGMGYQKSQFRSKSLSIKAHLRFVEGAASRFFNDHPDRLHVTYGELVDELKYTPRGSPLLGVNYDSIYINRNDDEISVHIPGTFFWVMVSF